MLLVLLVCFNNVTSFRKEEMITFNKVISGMIACARHNRFLDISSEV